MKKILVVSPLEDMKLHESKLKRCQVVGFRGKDKDETEVFFKNNLEAHPEDRVDMSFDKSRGELVIRVKMHPGEFLAIGDDEGVAAKEVLKGVD